MATGSGKTVVMAMLIAWHTLNKKAASTDSRFGDAFLIVTPGITIRDRLRVLIPSEANNYYKERDIVPVQLFGELLQAQILITNFHAFQLRDKLKTGKLNKAILRTDGLETPDEMVKRVCRTLGNKKNLVVINDEAHHCYRRKPEEIEEILTTEEKTAFQETMDEFVEEVSDLVDFNTLNVYPNNVDWSGKIIDKDIDFTFTIGENSGTYINGDMLKVDEDFLELINKLKDSLKYKQLIKYIEDNKLINSNMFTCV